MVKVESWIVIVILFLGACWIFGAPNQKDLTDKKTFRTQLISDTGECKIYKVYNFYETSFSTQCVNSGKTVTTLEEKSADDRTRVQKASITTASDL
jgi:hypothetical protein